MTSEEMVEGTLAELAPELLLAEGADGFDAPGTDPTEELLLAALDQEAARWIPECADEPAAASGAETPLDAEEDLVPSGPAQAGVAPVVAEDALFHPAVPPTHRCSRHEPPTNKQHIIVSKLWVRYSFCAPLHRYTASPQCDVVT